MRRKFRLISKIRFSIIGLSSLTLIVILIASYLTLLPPLQERSISNAQNINSQIMVQTDNMLESVQRYGNGITSSSDFNSSYINYISNPDDSRLREILRINLNQIASQMADVRNIIVETSNGLVLNSITNSDPFDQQLLQSAWYKKLRSIGFACGFSGVYRFTENGQVHFVSAYCKNTYSDGVPLTLTIFFKIDNIISVTNSLSQKNFDSYVWLDSSRNPFYDSANSDWIEMIKNKFSQINFVPQAPYFTGYNGYNFMNTSSFSNWMLVSYVSNRSLTNTFIQYFLTICLLMLVLFTVIILLVTPVVTKITKPVGKLAAVMSEVSSGNLNVVSTVNTNDEIGDLSRIFNQMVDDLRLHIQELLEKEELENRMKYSLLISQIDPHFIYNTMNTINYLAYNGRTEDIISINTALIKILQDRLRVSDIQIFDTLEQEKMIVDQYIVIQQCRFESDFAVNWSIGKDLLEIQIPKNIIQPLVENSMLHGLIDEEDGRIHGAIWITAEQIEKDLCLSVTDNGRGIEPELLEKLNKGSAAGDSPGKHIGLKNIRERLVYLYGNRECMQIESTPGKGTRIKITIPFQQTAE